MFYFPGTASWLFLAADAVKVFKHKNRIGLGVGHVANFCFHTWNEAKQEKKKQEKVLQV